jgi:HD-GYP domain-containing protein (c-di-GMP phosphodiesterase class II)
MRLINIDKLQAGMQTGQDLYDEYNRLLLGRGATLKSSYVVRLKQMGLSALYVQEADTSDISVPEMIPPAVRARAIQNLANTFQAVTRSLDGMRQLSIDEAHEHVNSKRFLNSIRSTTSNQGFDQIIGDVNALVGQIMNKDVILGLNSIKIHDNYTFQHSIDVTLMGLLLAKKTGWDAERLTAFGIGCLLHDMGKIFIQNDILNKPGRLTDDEFEIMRSHPKLGFDLIRVIAPNLSSLAAHVAYQHHERQDGSGYPRGLKGNPTLGVNEPNTIHDFGAVAAVADIYDAMASNRPYRQGWPIDRVVHLIEELSGSHLNPSVVEIFTKTVAPFPIGTNIRILSGSYVGYEGVVADIEDRNLAHPLVRLLFDAQGNRIDAVQLDLGIEEDIQLESVRDGAPQIEPLGSSKRVSTMLHQAEADRPIHPMIIANKPICTSCGYENEHSARFCSECGSTLPIPGKCLSCDHVNKPSAKFCSECGHRLAG